MTFDPLALRNQFPIFQKAERPLFYLDNAASSQIPKAVLDAVAAFETTSRANVSRGVHRLAEAATERFESARETVARYLGISDPKTVVFTSGTTAAVNLVAHSFGEGLKAGEEIVLSVAEHHSNIVPWQLLAQRRGVMLRYIDVTEDGRLDLSKLDETISPKCRLVALTHASNVTGAVSDVATVVAAAKAVGAKVLLDGAQRVPHGPIDVPALDVDFYAFSGHKMFAPHGIGVLWGREEALEALPPFMGGGGMIGSVTTEGATFAPPPYRFEAGTPPISQAVGLAAAMDWISGLDLVEADIHARRLTEDLLTELEALKGVRVIGPEDMASRLPVISFTVRNAHPHDVSQILDGEGVAVRGGHHCAQPLMDRFGIEGCTRASFTFYNNYSDILALLKGIDKVIRVFS